MNSTRPQLADIKHCTGCLVCADVCRKNAISAIINDEGHYTYHINEKQCVLCHQCEKICPVINGGKYGNNDIKQSTPYAAWTIDSVLREKSTSGGVFAGLAKFIIEQGGVVFGAIQDKYYVHHGCIYDIKDIKKLQGSKYTQSETTGVYKLVKSALEEGKKVLFSGMACQIAALLSFLGENKNLNNLVTVDLICGGVPSSYLIKKYVEQYGDSFDSIAGYREKNDYVFSVFDKNGKKKIVPLETRPLPLCGFYTNESDRYVCYDCPFAFAHRLSDLTIGDFWGNKLYPDQTSKGVSVAIVHSSKGMRVINNPWLEIHKIEWKDFLTYNPRMVCGYGHVSLNRKRLALAFKKYNYEMILEKYANKGSLSKPWTLVSKVNRFVIAKIVRIKRQIVAYKTLKNYL